MSTAQVPTAHVPNDQLDYEPELELPEIPDGSAIHTITDDEPPAFRDLYRVIDYPDPVNHGIGIIAVLNDLDSEQGSVYSRIWKAWRERVGNPEVEPYTVIEDAHQVFDFAHDDYPADIVLESSGWMAGTEAEDGELVDQWYKYSLKLARKDPETGEYDSRLRTPVSFQAWIQPQDQDLVYPDGEPLQTPYGEGTRFQTQSTYADPEEMLRRTMSVTKAVLDRLDAGTPDMRTLNYDSVRIWKGEVHHRFDKSLLKPVAETVRGARTLLEQHGRQARGEGEFIDGKHVEELAASTAWDTIGFMGKYAKSDEHELGAKVYQIGGQPADERLEHPKIEAFFKKTYDEQKPHIDEWPALRGTLRQIATGLAIRGGVGLEDLQPDDYYTPFDDQRVDIPIPKGWRHLVRQANEERERRILKATYESLSTSKWDIMYTIAMKGGEGATYDELQEVVGLTYDRVREIVAELEDQDILLRTTYPRIVQFHNAELRLNAAEKLAEVHPDRGLPEIRDDAEKRRERRQEERRQREESGDETDQDSESQDDVGDRPAWQRFDRLSIAGEQLGTALEKEYIEGRHVKVKTDEYPALFPPP